MAIKPFKAIKRGVQSVGKAIDNSYIKPLAPVLSQVGKSASSISGAISNASNAVSNAAFNTAKKATSNPYVAPATGSIGLGQNLPKTTTGQPIYGPTKVATPTTQNPQPTYRPTPSQIQYSPSNQQGTGIDTGVNFNTQGYSSNQTSTQTTPTQTTPAPTGFDYSQLYKPSQGYTDAKAAYIASLQPSKEELALQQQLAQTREADQLGLTQLEGQGRGIPVSIIRGQQEKLQKQNAIREQGLQDQLNALQQNRQAASQQAQALLTSAQQEEQLRQQQAQALQDQTKPFTFDGNLVRINPQTGQLETVAQGTPEAAKPITLSPGQVVIDPSTGQVIAQNNDVAAKNYTLSPGQIVVDSSGNVIAQGNIAAPKEPNAAAYQAYGFATRMDNSNKIIDNLDQKFTGVAGQGVKWTPEFLKSNDRKSIEQAERDFVNALLRRESGAAISPAEFDSAQKQYFPQAGDSAAVLEQKSQNRATALNAIKVQAAPVYQQQGQPIDQQTQSFSAPDLSSIQPNPVAVQTLQGRAKADGTLLTSQEIDQYAREVTYAQQQGYTNEQITAALNAELGYGSQGFSTVGSDTNAGAAKVAAAIRQVESGGNYNARGASGEIGAYQFMPSSWRSWAGQYLGNPNAPMTPQNQDAVAQARIQDLLNQGYNPYQVALIWNGGTPTVKRGTNRYGVAYDSGAYANKVLGAYNSIG